MTRSNLFSFVRVGLAFALLATGACTKGPDFEPPAPVAPPEFR
jgi:hypothetical protein